VAQSFCRFVPADIKQLKVPALEHLKCAHLLAEYDLEVDLKRDMNQ